MGFVSVVFFVIPVSLERLDFEHPHPERCNCWYTCILILCRRTVLDEARHTYTCWQRLAVELVRGLAYDMRYVLEWGNILRYIRVRTPRSLWDWNFDRGYWR